MHEKRSHFTSHLGFVLAAAGSAVGLGNLWRFPYLAAKYGGGIFLLVYILLAVTFGFTLMITEIAIGRKTRKSCIHAYKTVDKRFSALGPLSAIIPILIAPYYCVIGGWVLKYLFEFLLGHGSTLASSSYFDDFISISMPNLSNNPAPWFFLYILFTAAVVVLGVNKGIEAMSKFMMPILVLLSIFIAGYSLTLPGAMEGLKFYLVPNFANFSISTVLGAMGQLFYSMSLAMGIMITYGSYMKDESNLESSVAQIEIFDTAIALLAGLMIIPPVVAFNGGDPASISAGPGLMFGVLPKVFESMLGGRFIGLLFFLLVFFAALTSSVSLLETILSILQDTMHMKRKPAVAISIVYLLALGSLSCLGFGPLSHITPLGLSFLDFFDFITNSILMPIVAFITCILIGHVVGTKYIEDEVEKSGHVFGRKKIYRVTMRWIAPVILAVILLGELAKYFGIISI